MAGDDHKADTKRDITNYIERKVRNLLEYDMNKYQDPAWGQVAELFNEIVVPCESYYSKGLITLGNDIVKEVENHGCQTVYQRIPGTYNAERVSGDDNSDQEVEIYDCSRTINSIKAWIAYKEERF